MITNIYILIGFHVNMVCVPLGTIDTTKETERERELESKTEKKRSGDKY